MLLHTYAGCAVSLLSDPCGAGKILLPKVHYFFVGPISRLHYCLENVIPEECVAKVDLSWFDCKTPKKIWLQIILELCCVKSWKNFLSSFIALLLENSIPLVASHNFVMLVLQVLFFLFRFITLTIIGFTLHKSHIFITTVAASYSNHFGPTQKW